MCLSKPSMPAAPPPPQEAKAPDAAAFRAQANRARQPGMMAGGTLLTGPSGITTPPATTRTTLLGQ